MTISEFFKTACSIAICLWVGGCIVDETLRSWKPVARKCSIVVSNEYEQWKERVFKARIESMKSEENERQAREADKRKLAEVERARRSLEAEEKRQHEIRTAAEARHGRIMAFAERESPRLCRIYEQLKAEAETQSGKINDLKKTLAEFGEDAENDKDVRELIAQLETLQKSVVEIEKQMVCAYIAAKKYEAAPVRKEFESICRKAFDDGVVEAEAAIARYNELKKQK